MLMEFLEQLMIEINIIEDNFLINVVDKLILSVLNNSIKYYKFIGKLCLQYFVYFSLMNVIMCNRPNYE